MRESEGTHRRDAEQAEKCESLGEDGRRSRRLRGTVLRDLPSFRAVNEKQSRGGFFGLVSLALIALLALGSTAALAGRPAAQRGRGAGWLSFDGTPGPDLPTLSLLAADAQGIDLKAYLPGCQAEPVEAEGEAYSRLYGDGYGHPGRTGLPDLPVLRRLVEIPFGAEVRVEVVQAAYDDHALAELGLQPIYPLQPPVPKWPGAQENRPFVIDRAFYSSGGRYPETPVSLGEPYVVRGHRLLPVEVWPAAYDPSAGTLRLYREIAFRLRLRGSDVAGTASLAGRYASSAFDARLARQVLNYNQGRPAAPATGARVGYLIVTADAYYEAMLPFVSLKEGHGFEVTLARCADVGCGSPSAIQAYIQNAYETWPTPPSYVLLVGDTDTVPAWNGPFISTATDLYYGTMDGPGDWHPDIGRGRFPVRSAAQAQAMVDKVLAYDGLTGTEPWLKKASFVATCDNYTVAEGTHDHVAQEHTGPQGYWGRFPIDPQTGGDRLYCVTHQATHGDLVDAFNDGRWAIVYSGHGTFNGWEMGFGPADIRSLTSTGTFPLVASHACLSGNFGQAEVFGETWVLQQNKGALVFWGSSTYSFWDEDDVLERAMFDSLFVPGLPHADVATMTEDGLDMVEAVYPGSARYYRETYNVLGDPAIRILLEPERPTFALQAEPAFHPVCGSGKVTSSVTVDSILGYSDVVYLETGGLPGSITATLEPVSATVPFEAVLHLEVGAGTADGAYSATLTATDRLSITRRATIRLEVAAAPPVPPALISPADAAMDQSQRPAFQWNSAPATTYHLQVDPDPRFVAPLLDVTGIWTTGYTSTVTLDAARCYWWRVHGDNTCGPGDWAAPYRFATTAFGPALADDMEAGMGRWAHAARAGSGADHWQIAAANSHSPTHSWFVPDDAVVTDSWLRNAMPVTVTAGSTLVFWHRYAFEGSNYDGAVLEVSTDGGRAWSDLGAQIHSGGYLGSIASSYGNPLGGRMGWVGDLPEWTQVEVDLGAFAGRAILIRWRLGCDSSGRDEGWYVDDVLITARVPPGPPPTVASVFPSLGVAGRQRPIQIEGRGFIELPSVRFGETWLLSVTLITTRTLEAVVPGSLATGSYTLTLYNGDCQMATLPDAFRVLPADAMHWFYLPLVEKR